MAARIRNNLWVPWGLSSSSSPSTWAFPASAMPISQLRKLVLRTGNDFLPGIRAVGTWPPSRLLCTVVETLVPGGPAPVRRGR